MNTFQSQGHSTKVKGQGCLQIYVAQAYVVVYPFFKKLELIQT